MKKINSSSRPSKTDFTNISTLVVLRLLIAVFGLAYSILQVYLFGTSREIEVYFISQTLILLVVSISQSGQLGEVFIPEYHHYVNKYSTHKGDQFFSIVVNILALWSVGLFVLLYFAGPYLVDLMAAGYTAEDKLKVLTLFTFFSYFLPLQIFNSFSYSYFNARKIYGKSESIKLFKQILSIVLLLILHNRFGVWAMAYSFVLAIVVETVFIFFVYYKSKAKYYLLLQDRDINLTEFLKVLKNTMAYVFTSQFYNVALTSSISFLPEGTYAVFKYSQKVFLSLRTAVVQPILTIFNTNVSLAINSEKLNDLNSIIKTNFERILLILSFIVPFSIAFNQQILTLIWSNDNFGEGDMALAKPFFIVLSLLLFVNGLNGITRGVCIGFSKGRLIYAYSCIAQIISGITTYLMIRYLGFTGLIITVLLNGMLLGYAPMNIYFFKLKRPLGVIFKTMLPFLMALVLLLLFMMGVSRPISSLVDGFSLSSEKLIAAIELMTYFALSLFAYLGIVKFVNKTYYQLIVNKLQSVISRSLSRF